MTCVITCADFSPSSPIWIDGGPGSNPLEQANRSWTFKSLVLFAYSLSFEIWRWRYALSFFKERIAWFLSKRGGRRRAP